MKNQDIISQSGQKVADKKKIVFSYFESKFCGQVILNARSRYILHKAFVLRT